MKLTDLKIGTQLKIGFGIIVLLIILLGTIAWQQTTRMEQQTTNLYNHPYMVRIALEKLKNDILSMRLEFRNFILAKDDQGREKALLNTAIHHADAEKQFDILMNGYLGPIEDIENAHKAFLRWLLVRENNKDVGRAGNIDTAMSRVEADGDIGMEREKLLMNIEVIDNYAQNKANHFLKETIDLQDSLNWQLVFLVAGILALTIFITYLLNTNIRRPVTELANVTQLFREGKMEIRSSYQSKNEFGQLSTSFNHLAETIESELALNKRVAKVSNVMLSEDDAHRFCHVLLSALLEHTGSQLGAVYILNDEKTEFRSFESIGMELDKCQPFSAIRFEGEFGTALTTQKLQHINHIPEDTRFTFSSVSGKFAPREMITIPILSGNETIAVISLATIKNFNVENLRLLNTILTTLSARMDGILAYQKIISFSKQLENQNSELEAQKRELYAQASELTEQNIELEMQKRQLDNANRMKTSFLSNMSHELRTPLNSVIALSGVLNRRLANKVADEEYSYLDVIERNGKQLLSLINDILDLSRIEAGHEDIEISKFNIGGLINEVVEMIEPQADQKKIQLRYQDKNQLPDINCDYQKCRHILQNLVANAVKFTEVGGVEIEAETNDENMVIVISDTGIGIDKEHLPHIFDEFRQADSSNSRKYGGTGLGLAIAKKYTDMLGGTITVESAPGKGSRFILNLPMQNTTIKTNAKVLPHEFPVFSVNKTKINMGKLNTKEKTILLVEDTEAMIVQMKDMLESQGYNIMVARNGNEALNQIENKVPNAMILDLMMPEVDGFEVLKSIRDEEKTSRLPVIILTAKYVSKEELWFLKSNGIHQIIRKGEINKDQMLEAVAQMVFTETKNDHSQAQKIPNKNPITGTPIVLVVEDNKDNLLTIKALLDGKCSIIEANDGLMAIELAELHQPHLILMDIALPGLNGIETLAELRRMESLKQIPIIAVSASAMKGDKEDFLAFGFDGYIPKPIDSLFFEKTISEFLG